MPQPSPNPTRKFASDNNAGVHPEILEAIARANQGHVVAYGDDPYHKTWTDAYSKVRVEGTTTFDILGQ